jgi:hypothetical protein
LFEDRYAPFPISRAGLPSPGLGFGIVSLSHAAGGGSEPSCFQNLVAVLLAVALRGSSTGFKATVFPGDVRSGRSWLAAKELFDEYKRL